MSAPSFASPARADATLLAAAEEFAADFANRPHPKLKGVKDSKRVGGYIEGQFKAFLAARGLISADEGNAARGIDLPSWNTDIKSTSSRQPQSSTPFTTLRQRIEGIGHHLLLFVYERQDDRRGARFTFTACRFIPAALTGDHATTQSLRELLAKGARQEAVFGWLQALAFDQEFADAKALRAYARELVANPPAQGLLTMSPALQWRLQYRRVVGASVPAGILEAQL